MQYFITANNAHYKTKSNNHYILDPPVIDEGPHIPRPSVITRGNKTVKIGTPVYVHDGFDVIIDCNIVNGTSPITIQWFHNGSPDTTRGNVSTITITDASNGDVLKCRADNLIGFDTKNTVIHVKYGKCTYILYSYILINLCVICLFVCHCVCMLMLFADHKLLMATVQVSQTHQ